MATDISTRYLAEARARLKWTPLWVQIKLAPWIKRWRLLCLKLGSKKVHGSSASPEITARFDEAGAHFKEHRWAFVESVISSAFYDELLKHWPKKRYLEPPREVEKSYNTGFRWITGDSPNFSYSDPYQQYPGIQKLLAALRSEEMAKRVTQFSGSKEPLMLYSFILTDAGAGAEVVPHKDSIKDDPTARYVLNCIFFIDASGGKNSGALTLSRDNELKAIMFEPPVMKNSCLIYDILGDFYHGFPPIAKGKWRWVVTAQYCQKSYVAR